MKEGLSRMLWVGTASVAFVLGVGGLACASIPEIDPGTATSGLALLVGAVMLLREAYRRR